MATSKICSDVKAALFCFKAQRTGSTVVQKETFNFTKTKLTRIVLYSPFRRKEIYKKKKKK